MLIHVFPFEYTYTDNDIVNRYRDWTLLPTYIIIVYTHFMHRVVTRAVMVDFNLPAVAPQSDPEEEAFAELEDILALDSVSSAIGWP